MLFNGEHVGDGTGPDVDIAVDPIDGTTLTAKSLQTPSVSCASLSKAQCLTPARPSIYAKSRFFLARLPPGRS